MTHRQFLAWQEFILEPSTTDYYLMQATRELLLIPNRVWGGKDPLDLPITKFKLEREKPKPPLVLPKMPKGFPRVVTKEDIQNFSKYVVMAASGYRSNDA